MAKSEAKQLSQVQTWLNKDQSETSALLKEATHQGTFIRGAVNLLRAKKLNNLPPMKNPLAKSPEETLPLHGIKTSKTKSVTRKRPIAKKVASKTPPKKTVAKKNGQRSATVAQAPAISDKGVVTFVTADGKAVSFKAPSALKKEREEKESIYPKYQKISAGKWQVTSATGRPLGTHRTKEKARKQQIAIIMSMKRAEKDKQ